ncbi:LCP family protein [Lactococcus nasutitermitis]|uniref:Regulatory protein MsrR n=1 Tax=Lactococcus nasutitermitis TaxID=1652957 RepID=A0ABV9JBA1_9LACT|nr:LCP family protein [Lactococcus nasutitermitis]
MIMDEKKYKRLEYLKHNIDFLSIRERQEYYALRSELEGNQSYSQNNIDYTEDFTNSYDENEVNDSSENFSDVQEQSHDFREADTDRNSQKVTGNSGQKNKKPRKKKKRHWIRNILVLILLIIVVMVGFFIHGYQRGVKHEGGVVKSEKFDALKNTDGTTNILLLGADQRPGQKSTVAHSDSIMVLHLDTKKHQAKIVSFMRDTLVNIKDVSSSDQPDVKINAAFTIGEQEDPMQGANLLSETLYRNFGVKCQYYAIVDFSSFATIIDSLFPNGIKIDAKFSTINGQKMSEVPVPDDLATTEGKVSSDETLTSEQAYELGYPDGGGIFMMIKQGEQKMNGRTLLNYARFRHDDEGDYGRVKRQQQVMATITSKVKNPLTLFTASSALGTARAITMTNIPNSFFIGHGVGTLMDLKNGIKSTTIPADGDWQNSYDIYGGMGLLLDMPKYKAEAERLLGQ